MKEIIEEEDWKEDEKNFLNEYVLKKVSIYGRVEYGRNDWTTIELNKHLNLRGWQRNLSFEKHQI